LTRAKHFKAASQLALYFHTYLHIPSTAKEKNGRRLISLKHLFPAMHSSPLIYCALSPSAHSFH